MTTGEHVVSLLALGMAVSAFGLAVWLVSRIRHRAKGQEAAATSPEPASGLRAALRKRATDLLANLILSLAGVTFWFVLNRLNDHGRAPRSDVVAIVFSLVALTLAAVAMVRRRRAAVAVAALAGVALFVGVADDRPCVLGPAAAARPDGPETAQVVPIPTYAVVPKGHPSAAPSPDEDMEPARPPSTPAATATAPVLAEVAPESCATRVPR